MLLGLRGNVIRPLMSLVVLAPEEGSFLARQCGLNNMNEWKPNFLEKAFFFKPPPNGPGHIIRAGICRDHNKFPRSFLPFSGHPSDPSDPSDPSGPGGQEQ